MEAHVTETDTWGKGRKQGKENTSNDFLTLFMYSAEGCFTT